MPLLDNGQPGYVGHELAAPTPVHPPHLLFDIALPFVAAIALPFLLKYALESEVVARLFRFTPSAPRTSHTKTEDDFDAF